jgi:hypothetical protein
MRNGRIDLQHRNLSRARVGVVAITAGKRRVGWGGGSGADLVSTFAFRAWAACFAVSVWFVLISRRLRHWPHGALALGCAAVLSGCSVLLPFPDYAKEPAPSDPISAYDKEYAKKEAAEAEATVRTRLTDPCSLIDQQKLSLAYPVFDVWLEDFDECTIRLGNPPVTQQTEVQIRPQIFDPSYPLSGAPRSSGNTTVYLEPGSDQKSCQLTLRTEPFVRFIVDVRGPTQGNKTEACPTAEKLIPTLSTVKTYPRGLYPVRDLEPCAFVKALEPGLGRGSLTEIRPDLRSTDCRARVSGAEVTVDVSFDMSAGEWPNRRGIRLFDLVGHPAVERIIPPEKAAEAGDNTCTVAWNIGAPVAAAEHPKYPTKFQTVTARLKPDDPKAPPPCQQLNDAVPAAAALVR